MAAHRIRVELLIAALISGFALAATAAPIPDLGYEPRIVREEATPIRLLFDEAHNNIHTTAGGYLAFARLMRANSVTIAVNTQSITAAALEAADVLAIVNAAAVPDIESTTPAQMNEPAFSGAELDAIEGWVRRGGSLLLVSDHYPTGGAAHELSERFGVRMSNGWVSDERTYDNDVTGNIFSIENGLLRPHPIARGRNAAERVNRIATFTGQALYTTADRYILALGASAMEEPLAASGEGRGEAHALHGAAQGAAFAFGRGRVVILGEAAMLTSQMGGPEPTAPRWGGLAFASLDNEQFALNVVNWLGHRY